MTLFSRFPRRTDPVRDVRARACARIVQAARTRNPTRPLALGRVQPPPGEDRGLRGSREPGIGLLGPFARVLPTAGAPLPRTRPHRKSPGRNPPGCRVVRSAQTLAICSTGGSFFGWSLAGSRQRCRKALRTRPTRRRSTGSSKPVRFAGRLLPSMDRCRSEQVDQRAPHAPLPKGTQAKPPKTNRSGWSGYPRAGRVARATRPADPRPYAVSGGVQAHRIRARQALPQQDGPHRHRPARHAEPLGDKAPRRGAGG